MAEEPSNWWNTSKNSNEHSVSNLQFSGFGFSASSSDWSQTPIFHAMLQEDLSTGNFLRQEYKEINQQPLMLSSSSSYGCSATMPMMQSLIEPDYQSQMTAYGLTQKQQSADINLMQFTSNSSIWNASSGIYHSSVSPPERKFFETNSSRSTSLSAKGSEGFEEKKTSSESVVKKPRIDAIAPIKVRKEKIGDRITALQQLVSPFGKTDTASVLHEVIEYIKFLHDQVSVLSTPYLMDAPPKRQQKNSGKSKKREEPMQDLRSRGLCLVPIASTNSVTSEANSDFWSTTFGGTYN